MANTKITSRVIADDAISTDMIQDNAITSAKIGVDVIVAEDLAANSITVSELNKTALSGQSAVTAVGADYILIGDTSDSDNLKKALLSDVIEDTTLSTEEVQDIVGAMFSSNTETRISASYEDGDGTIDLVVDDMTANDNTWRPVTAGGNTLTSSETLAFTAGTGITIAESGGAVTITNSIADTNLTTEEVQDIVGGMVDDTETGISVTYDDTNGNLEFVLDAAQPTVTSLGTLTGLTIDGDTTLTGANANVVWDKSADSLEFADGTYLKIGTGNDLQIYHNGSNSFIKDTGTGSLIMSSNQLSIQKSDNTEAVAVFNEDGDVKLYYDDSLKLATVTGGVNVTGTLTATSTSAIQATFTGYADTGANAANGKIVLGSTSAYQGVLQYSSDGNTTLFLDNTFDDAGAKTQFRMRTNGTDVDALTILGSGNVGIGNSTPSSNHAKANNLVVGSGSAGGMAIYNGTAEGWYAFSRDNANNSDAFDGGISYTNREMGFHTNSGSERMRISAQGNVGIGTGSPQKELHIFKTEGGVGAKHATIRMGGYSTVGAEIAAYRVDGNSNNQGLIFSSYHQTNGTVDVLTIDNKGAVEASNSARIGQQAITSTSNAVAWDAKGAANAYYLTTQNTTFSAPTNEVEGAIISVEIAQGGTAYTVAWDTKFEFAASTAPTVTATANKTDIFSFRYNGSVWQEIGRVQNLGQT